MKLTIPNVLLRGKIFYFNKRVPSDLVEHYGTPVHKISLQTTDIAEASRKANTATKLLELEYAQIREGKSTPESVIKAAQKLLKSYGAWGHSDKPFNPKSFEAEIGAEQFRDKLRQKAMNWAIKKMDEGDTRGSDEIIDSIDETTGLFTPAEITALQLLRKRDENKQNKDKGVIYLSDAIAMYFKEHPRGNDPKFHAFTSRHMDYITECLGDVPLTSLSRKTHGFKLRDDLVSKKFATATIRRILNTANAIVNSAILNYELPMQSPFKQLVIQGEGLDKKPIPEFSAKLKAELRKKFSKEKSSVAFMIRIILGTGARVGEIAQLSINDIYLDTKVPFIWLRPNELRSRLKNEVSIRQVVLVGDALEAIKEALTAHGKQDSDHLAPGASLTALFPEYGSPRGGDTASAAINKRLPDGLTSKIGRHWWDTAAKLCGIGKDFRTAVLGHAHQGIHAQYEESPLELLQELMQKVEHYSG
jgi:integrase